MEKKRKILRKEAEPLTEKNYYKEMHAAFRKKRESSLLKIISAQIKRI